MLLRFFLVLFFFLAHGYGHLNARVFKNGHPYSPLTMAAAKPTAALNIAPNTHSACLNTTKEKELAGAETGIFEEEKDDEEVSVKKYVTTSNYFTNYLCTQAEEYFNIFLTKRFHKSGRFLFAPHTNRYIMFCVIRI